MCDAYTQKSLISIRVSSHPSTGVLSRLVFKSTIVVPDHCHPDQLPPLLWGGPLLSGQFKVISLLLSHRGEVLERVLMILPGLPFPTRKGNKKEKKHKILFQENRLFRLVFISHQEYLKRYLNAA